MTTTEENTVTLDYATAYDGEKCSALIQVVLGELGASNKVLERRRKGEPDMTFAQLAKMMALESGFHPTCIGKVVGCASTTVTYAQNAINRRVAAQQRGTPNTLHGNSYPLAPLLERVRYVAARWREEHV